MNRPQCRWAFLAGCLLACLGWVNAGPEPVRPESASARSSSHHLPWFTAKPTSPRWGWHWTMNTFDPEKSNDGKRCIASYYYPLIGPYDSGDDAVLEYHLLLMKLAGIDGVVVDWYGLSDYLDYRVLHRNTTALFRMAARLGLHFAICYEDQTIARLVVGGKLAARDRVKHARQEIEWLQKNWFTVPGYVKVHGRPLLLSFGWDGLTNREWRAVFEGMEKAPLYLSEHRRRAAASGAFDWPVPKDYPASLERYDQLAKTWSVAMPVAFPRFHDVYAEARDPPEPGHHRGQGRPNLGKNLAAGMAKWGRPRAISDLERLGGRNGDRTNGGVWLPRSGSAPTASTARRRTLPELYTGRPSPCHPPLPIASEAGHPSAPTRAGRRRSTAPEWGHGRRRQANLASGGPRASPGRADRHGVWNECAGRPHRARSGHQAVRSDRVPLPPSRRQRQPGPRPAHAWARLPLPRVCPLSQFFTRRRRASGPSSPPPSESSACAHVPAANRDHFGAG